MNHWWSCIRKAQQDPHEASDVYRTKLRDVTVDETEKKKEGKKTKQKTNWFMNISFFLFFPPSDFTCSCMWNLVSNDARNARPLSLVKYLRYLDVAHTHGRSVKKARFSLPLARYTVLKLHSKYSWMGLRLEHGGTRTRCGWRNPHSPPVTVEE